MPIRIYVTGGTFDKEYDELNGRLFFQDSHLRDMLRLGRCNLDLEIRTLMMIDSLEMTEIDRDTIRKNCTECDTDQIVITHGTDTMEATARVLGKAITDKTIVLVEPWSRTHSAAPTACSIWAVRWPTPEPCRTGSMWR